MDFRQLEYLVELDKSRNFTYAAEKLFLTPGALMHFLTKLEQEEGALLFLRGKTGLIPTETGELYVRMAKDMLKVSRKYQNAIMEKRSHSAEHFTVAGLPQIAEIEFPLICRDFFLRFPETTVDFIFSLKDAFSCEQLINGTVDIAMGIGSCNQEKALYKGKLLFESLYFENILLVLPLNQSLPEKMTDPSGFVDLSLFKDSVFFCPTYDNIEQIFAMHHFSPPKIHYTATAVSAFQYVKSGDGVGLIAPSGILDHTAVRCFQIKPTLSLPFYLIYRAGEPLTKAQKRFCTLSKKYLYEKIRWADTENFHT